MNTSMTAGFLWPRYNEIVRVGFCTDMISTAGVLLLVSTVISLVCFPVFACLAEYDLEEWLNPVDEEETQDLKKEHSDVSHRDEKHAAPVAHPGQSMMHTGYHPMG